MRRTRRIAAGAVTAFAAVSLAAGGLTVAARAATKSPQAILYAAPSGTGAACSVTQPCSITAAKQAVERLDRQMTGNIDVELLGGTYHVPGGLQLGVADSGTSGHDVVWRAAPGQHPVIPSRTMYVDDPDGNEVEFICRTPA